jgi:hypothetical protein
MGRFLKDNTEIIRLYADIFRRHIAPADTVNRPTERPQKIRCFDLGAPPNTTHLPPPSGNLANADL